jgi:transposase
MEKLSDRAAVQMVRTRIDWKYALHLPLNDRGLDASVLCEFRARLVGGKLERKIFDALLEKFKEQGLFKGRRQQRTDALQIVAAVRKLNRLELVMETMRLAIEELVEADVEWVKKNVPGEWIETYGEWTESERLVKESGPNGEAETERLLKETGRDGVQLLEQLEADGQARELRELKAIKRLEQVWRQQYRRVGLKDSEIALEMSTKQSRAEEGVGREIIATPHDVEARYSEKRGIGNTGYKLHLTEVAEEGVPALITDVEVVGAQEYDGGALEGIHERLKERGLLPEEHLVDKGYISGDAIAASQKRGVKLLGPMWGANGSQNNETNSASSDVSVKTKEEEDQKSGARGVNCLELEEFRFNFKQQEALCPKGIRSRHWVKTQRRDRGQAVVVIYWDKKQCLGCPLAPLSVHNHQRGRVVRLSENYRAIAQRRDEQRKPEFKQKYRRRAGIEASLSTLVRGYKGRRTPYRGRAKTRANFLRIATVMNLKRAVAWKQGSRPKRDRIVRMKKVLGLERVTRKGWGR